jgi:hypothetical protein
MVSVRSTSLRAYVPMLECGCHSKVSVSCLQLQRQPLNLKAPVLRVRVLLSRSAHSVALAHSGLPVRLAVMRPIGASKVRTLSTCSTHTAALRTTRWDPEMPTLSAAAVSNEY